MVENTYCAGKQALLARFVARRDTGDPVSRGVNAAHCPAGENLAAAGLRPGSATSSHSWPGPSFG